MERFDVFNGDADGICALHQLRLAEPAQSVLVTGMKRDIDLLQRVEAGAGDEVTVLDVSLDRNREALLRLLDRGVRVRWFDHHFAGDIPPHPGLDVTIDLSERVCTSILVDRYLRGRFRPWAVVAAFGDNLDGPARELAAALGLEGPAVEALRELGINLNYGACGETEADVLMPAVETYRLVSRFPDPAALSEERLVSRLGQRRRADLEYARRIAPSLSAASADAFVLPDAPWSRRVMSTFANELASADPLRAHAVLVPNAQGGYAVSLRSPPHAPSAAQFCRGFASGGGRARAAGVNHLDGGRLTQFLHTLANAWRA